MALTQFTVYGPQRKQTVVALTHYTREEVTNTVLLYEKKTFVRLRISTYLTTMTLWIVPQLMTPRHLCLLHVIS